jgi:hypothetical protein
MTDTDTADLVARLRAGPLIYNRGPDYEPLKIPPSQQALEIADTIERLTRERDEARAKAGHLTTLLDQQMGTPCEQIRHAQEVEQLTRERDDARLKAVKVDQGIARAVIDGRERIAKLERERDEARALLCKWDALIKHQYTGSREAMSDMARVAQETVASLRTEGDTP